MNAIYHPGYCGLQEPVQEFSRRTLLQEAAFLAVLSATLQTQSAQVCSKPSRLLVTPEQATRLACIKIHTPGSSVLQAEEGSKRGIARYIKKKSLEPLETYVPAVVAARNQLQRAGTIMSEPPPPVQSVDHPDGQLKDTF